ncbi:hypothetical protein PACTADRAFT_76279 [Pachysolen tannophilus NRRL Y-2460]|uniref:Uncharacterized protein n=1 Tax=Pachysolen tannophilus NRRL Y-2460 TaxID=669874 RepID=A0A1E4TSE3_PACTA|nr:hypothetical protein PACTADRAFT_76279 [Pachysolen tannophilus NRRL Y-2460]
MLKASVFNGFNGSNESNGMNGSNGSNKGLNNSIVVVDSELSFCNSYQLAIKNYLNKNFHHSWNLILPLINEVLQGRKLIGNRDLAIGCFKLYFSLVDLFLKKPELFNLPRSERVIIEKEFKNGLLVNQLLVISGNDYGKIDSELFFIASLIEFGNEFEITKLELQLENYLRSNDYLTSGGFENDNKNLRKILSLYLFKVLPKNHNFEKSQELIEKIYIRDDIKISQKLAKLKQVKTNLQKIEEANKMEKTCQEKKRRGRRRKRKRKENKTINNNQRSTTSTTTTTTTEIAART